MHAMRAALPQLDAAVLAALVHLHDATEVVLLV